MKTIELSARAKNVISCIRYPYLGNDETGMPNHGELSESEIKEKIQSQSFKKMRNCGPKTRAEILAYYSLPAFSETGKKWKFNPFTGEKIK
jgi:hypothetical protein